MTVTFDVNAVLYQPTGDEMENSKKQTLSVIVPLYNDAEYIDVNLNSVLANANQLDLEIIIIDDGSTDNSREVAASSLADKNARYEIVTKPNGGLSSARNTGLSLAKGEYVAFLDSDDFVAPDIYSKLLDFAIRRKCDQVFARSMVFDDVTGSASAFFDSEFWDRILDGEVEKAFLPFEIPIVFRTQPKICTRIWRREYLLANQLSFPEGKVFEDIGFHLRALALNGRVGILNETGLFYREGHSERITGKADQTRYDVIDNARSALKSEEFQALEPTVGSHALAALLAMVFWCRMGLPREMKITFDKKVAELFPLVSPEWISGAGKIDEKVTRRFLRSVGKNGSSREKLKALRLRARIELYKTLHLE